MTPLIIFAIIGFVVLWLLVPRTTLVVTGFAVAVITGLFDKYFSVLGLYLTTSVVILLILVGIIFDISAIRNFRDWWKE